MNYEYFTSPPKCENTLWSNKRDIICNSEYDGWVLQEGTTVEECKTATNPYPKLDNNTNILQVSADSLKNPMKFIKLPKNY